MFLPNAIFSPSIANGSGESIITWRDLNIMLSDDSAQNPNGPISLPVGIAIGLIASIIQSLGLTMQRKSHILNEMKPEDQRTVEHRRPLWILGFLIFITSNILGSIFQIASLPVVILAPLGAVSLLWNAFFARILLGDEFSSYMVLGTLAIAGGAVLIAIFGVIPVPAHSLEDLIRLFRREAFVVYFSLLGAALGVCLLVTHIVEFTLRHKLVSPPETPPHPASPTSPTFSPRLQEYSDSPLITTERTPLLPPPELRQGKGGDSLPTIQRRSSVVVKRTKTLLAGSYASASGIMSGMCLLFAKSGVELLILTAQGDNQFWRWEAWALVAGLIAFAFLQLWYLHKSLVLADPILVCPLAFCFYNLSSIFNGLVYYDQFGSLSALHLGLVVLGLCILLGGVFAVSVTSGDGGVEPGTWREGGEDVEEEVVGAEESPSLGQQSDHRRGSVITTSALASPDATGGSSSVSLISPVSAVGRQRSGPRKRQYTNLLGVGAREGSSGGLSIGLSATSPGFALKPTKRRVSTQGDIFYMTASRMEMRRAVSEADAGTAGESVRARARWKWLQNVLRSSEGEQQE